MSWILELDTVKVEHTYKHPCLFTVTVDGFRAQSGSPATSPHQDLSQWHLPAFDPTNQAKYMYRLHTVDVYFWTPDDAVLFLDSLRRVLQPHQLQVVHDPNRPSSLLEHKNDALSPVIARLENAAISHSSPSPNTGTTQSFPGPPTAPAPASSPPGAGSASYAPMAYNPAAPAAPEPIAHREKTPPPLDAADGTGLGTAAMQDHHASQYSNPLQTSFAPQSTSSPYMPGPPAPGQGFSGPPGIQRTHTMGSVPSASPGPPSFAPPPSAPPLGQYGSHDAPPPGLQRTSTMPSQQYANYPGSPGFPPGPQSPRAQQQYQGLASPPPGGYSQYSYEGTSQQSATPIAQPIHQQLYRPTEGGSAVEPPAAPQRNSNVGKRVEKVEKGMGRFLKKLDQKF